jgi:hypothetical protein
MAKKKAAVGGNKSEFIRNALGKNADLNLAQINALWARNGGEGEITGVLFYQVRRKMGLKRAEYRWMLNEDAES